MFDRQDIAALSAFDRYDTRSETLNNGHVVNVPLFKCRACYLGNLTKSKLKGHLRACRGAARMALGALERNSR